MRCCESEEWQEEAGVHQLQAGPNQVFYHCLVDVRDWDQDLDQPPVAYVAEELLSAPEVRRPADCSYQHALGSRMDGYQRGFRSVLGRTACVEGACCYKEPVHCADGRCGCWCALQAPSTWVQEYGEDPLQHPYNYMVFLGRDAAGDMMPSRSLRDKYSAQRRDVYPPGTAEEDDDDQDYDTPGPSGMDFGAI